MFVNMQKQRLIEPNNFMFIPGSRKTEPNIFGNHALPGGRFASPGTAGFLAGSLPSNPTLYTCISMLYNVFNTPCEISGKISGKLKMSLEL